MALGIDCFPWLSQASTGSGVNKSESTKILTSGTRPFQYSHVLSLLFNPKRRPIWE